MSEMDRRMGGPPVAVRLIFLYDGTDIRLLSRLPVDVVVPPADMARAGRRSGFWIEVRTATEDVLYRRVMTDPVHLALDVFSPGPSEGSSRREEPPPVGAFTVLVPNEETASHVVLMGAPPDREIARFPIDDAAAPSR